MKYSHIRDLREDRDLTQAEIALLLGIAQNTYSQYETGTISYVDEVLEKLADYYHVSIDYLMDRTDIPTPPPPMRFKIDKA